MKRYKQFQPLVISVFEADVWPHPRHRHNHYELIYILSGSGKHHIDDHEMPYASGNIFLVGPDEAHDFKIAEPTRFLFIKFTDVYIHNHNATYGLQQLEYLMKSRETHRSGFELSHADQFAADAIIGVVIALEQDMLSNEQLIWQQVLGLSVLLQRNMPELRATVGRSRDMQAIFCYLHKYIYTPAKLKSSVLTDHFNTAPDYIGPYFKRNTGSTLRDYVGQYRKILIRQRLESGNYSLKQIAAEFRLTDESHVRKLMM